jgi:hypothetical protein
MASSLVGYWYRFDPNGTFYPLGDPAAASSSPGDGTVCVTGVEDVLEPTVCQALRSAVNLPDLPIEDRWTIDWATLKASWQNGTKISLLVTTA